MTRSAEEKKRLLDFIFQAHGGLDLWRKVQSITAKGQCGGIALPFKGKPRAFKHYEIKIFPEQPYAVITPFPKPGFRGGFFRNKVWIENIRGETVGERANPRDFLSKFRRTLWWDDLDALYFGGYALWNYLTLPFFFSDTDLKIEELDRWKEGQEGWRRLQVTFPGHFPTHCQKQVFYIDGKGMVRRHDYTAEVIGKWARAARYLFDPKEFSGLTFPTKYRIWPRLKGRPFRGITLVSINFEDIEVIWKS